jgi:hypothetical protein
MKGFRLACSSRETLDFVSGNLKNFVTLPLNYTAWGPKRTMPKFAKKSFSQQYKDSEMRITNNEEL